MSKPALQPHEGPVPAGHYLPSTPATITWGRLPTAATPPALTIRSGETLTVDTVSHEGMLEDQGRDPRAFFAGFGIAAEGVLRDAAEIAEAHAPRDVSASGPHVVTGPIRVAGALPGDVL